MPKCPILQAVKQGSKVVSSPFGKTTKQESDGESADNPTTGFSCLKGGREVLLSWGWPGSSH